MAESSQEIDLSRALRYTGEAGNLRPIDQTLDAYAHSGQPEAAFDKYAALAARSHNAKAEDGQFASAHVGAAVGAMILRAEAKMPGAKQAWKDRHSRVDALMTKGGVIMGMVSVMGDEIAGAGSITGLYLATNAADPDPEFSVFNTPARVTVVDRVQQMRHKGAPGNFGPTQNGGEVWNSDRIAEICRGYLQAYLGREQRLRVTDPDAIIAGAYGAVMLRTGALARAYRDNDPIMQRHIEDYVSAAARLRRGRGDHAVLSELNPVYTDMYRIGSALLERAGVKIRTWHGPVDGAVRAVSAVKGAFSPTEVKFNKYVPQKDQPQPKEFTDPMTTQHRRGTVTNGGGLPPRGAGAQAKKAPPGTSGAANEAAAAARRASANTRRPEMRTFAPRASELVRRPLAVMVGSTNLHNEIAQARRDPENYPQWAELFAALRMRIAAKNATPEELAYFAPNQDIISRLALRQIADGGQMSTLGRLERGETVTTEMYAATLDIRRWLTSIANGRIVSKEYSPKQAQLLAMRLKRAQERQVRAAYDIPADEHMTPALFETLNELNVLRLAGARVLEEPQHHTSFLRAVISRIVSAMQALDADPALPDGSANTFWQRTRAAMQAPGPIRSDDLPPVARRQYQALRRQAVGLFPESFLDA